VLEGFPMIRLPMNAKWLASVSLSVAVFALAPVAAAKSFHKLSSTCARSIAAAEGTSPWVISCALQGDGNYWADYYDSSLGEWLTTNGSGVEVGALYETTTTNYPLIVQSSGAIYYGQPGGSDIDSSSGPTVSWSSLGGCGTSISGAGTGVEYPHPYVTGCPTGGAGNAPTYFDASGVSPNDWTTFGGDGTRISVSQDDTEFWLVNSNGSIYNFTGLIGEGGSWGSPQPGTAIDVSAGSGTESSANVPPWMVDSDNNLNQWNGSGWSSVSGGPPASRVSVGYNGTVWIIDIDRVVWYYN
jgi:hypothetical protein